MRQPPHPSSCPGAAPGPPLLHRHGCWRSLHAPRASVRSTTMHAPCTRPAWWNQPRCHCPATGGQGRKKKLRGARALPPSAHARASHHHPCAQSARAPWRRPRRCSIAMDDDRLRAHHPRAHPPLQPPCRSAAAASAATSCPGEAHRHLAVARHRHACCMPPTCSYTLALLRPDMPC